MFEEKYKKLSRLKIKRNFGYFLIIIIFIIMILLPFIKQYSPYIKEMENISPFIYVGICIVLWILVIILVYPFYKYRGIISSELKEIILKEEMNKIFNNSYKNEDKNKLDLELNQLNIVNIPKNINDCFSIKNNNYRIKYADVQIKVESADSLSIIFEGAIISFELSKYVDETIYIGSSKGDFGEYLSRITDTTDLIDLKPEESEFREDIIVKGKNKTNYINDSSFQNSINSIILNSKIMIIISKNKMYYLINNLEDNFEIKAKNEKEETILHEKINTKTLKFKNELDEILKYKNELNIKEDNF